MSCRCQRAKHNRARAHAHQIAGARTGTRIRSCEDGATASVHANGFLSPFLLIDRFFFFFSVKNMK